jgi:hypothetical protein
MDYAKEYSRLHRSRLSVFAGRSILPHVDKINELVKRYRPKRMLDYGCGKGVQYEADKVHERWGVMPTLYDIGYHRYQERPVGKFDAIICTDVLEHIAEPDIEAFLADVFSFLIEPGGDQTPFIFFSVTCRPAKKKFHDGRNLHLTVQLPGWWQERIRKFKKDGVHLAVTYMGVTNEDH